jgi:predicted MFS family arabinose efflux permease
MSKAGQTEPGESSLRKTLASGILALAVAMGIGRLAYTPILPAMQATFGLSNGMSGALASSNYLGYLVGAILAAVVPSTRRQTLLLRASLIVVVLTTCLVAFTTEFWVWMAVRFVGGSRQRRGLRIRFRGHPGRVGKYGQTESFRVAL